MYGRSTLFSYPCKDNNSCNSIKIYLEPGYWKLECWGASGGDSLNKNENVVFKGGRGGYSVGIIKIEKREEFYLTIGGSGYSIYKKESHGIVPGGFNGGGNGHIGTLLHPASSGGGATDIKRGGIELEDRIIVAGGGGGAGVGSSNYIEDGGQFGGAGGGEEGLQGGHYDATDSYSTLPTGGTQKSPGKLGLYISNPSKTGEDGDFGKGLSIPNSIDYESSGGSGGGGYYGGGSSYATGGAGGSGYIDKILFSYKKIIAKTIAGNESIPNPLSGYEIGHLGHGYIQITDVTFKPITCKRKLIFSWNLNVFIMIFIIK